MIQINKTGKKTGKKMNNEFPKEEYIELKGLSPELVGRVCITQNQNYFDAVIDIILSESGKIYKHIDIVYKQEDEREAMAVSIHRLKRYLSSLKNS